MTPDQYQDSCDLIEERGENKSLVLTSQLPLQNFNEVSDDHVTCEAITDRIVGNPIVIKMKGASKGSKVGKV